LDPTTAFVVATAFTLLNGAVLGFIHSALSDDLKPSSADWRIGTLLVAAGGVLFAANGVAQVDLLVPLANGALLFGVALYLRSTRRYARQGDSWWIYLPAVLATALNALFILVWPNIAARVVIVSAAISVYLIAMVLVLSRHRRIEPSTSSGIMIAVCLVVTVLLMARLAYYVIVAPNVQSITASGNIVNALSPALILTLPIVGTTVLALMCFERMRSELHRVATTDALTGLPNRRTISERAVQRFVQAKALAQPFSVAVIDIDHFKRINDRYGHDAGDHVLQRVANTLSEHVRGKQFVGRQGGEEFVALLEDANAQDAASAAERLRAAIAAATKPSEKHVEPVTASIGVATIDEDDVSFDDLLRRADRALYAAKNAGRNCVRSS
jgi:diguanylate cyclase (GGDEF)-like protein